MAVRCIPSEAAARFPVIAPGDGTYRRPPGPFMRAHGPGMQLARHGAYVLSPDGRGTSDLQTFVNRVHATPHSFPHDAANPTVLGEMHGQRFPAGQIRSPYRPVDQFSPAPYIVPREPPAVKVEQETNGAAPSGGFTDGSPTDTGNTLSLNAITWRYSFLVHWWTKRCVSCEQFLYQQPCKIFLWWIVVHLWANKY